ncbi:MAG: molybdopterin molybdotransferase MoeA [Planctomycetota bacterium]|nr:molybdopterin molybdotransferase MoeA [Planctomycetota bacterium]
MTNLPDYHDALIKALSIVNPLLDPETVPLSACSGRVLVDPIRADRNLPPFNRAQMDGYALHASDIGKVESFPVIATIAAGMPADVEVPVGHCVKIATGAPLPEDVDCVIQHENSDRNDPVHFSIDTIEPGHAVHPLGADAKEGDVLLEAPALLMAHHLGIAASVGATSLKVSRKPRVIVLSSGDEVVEEGAEVLTHQIRNSNGPLVTELLYRMGAEPLANNHVEDELEATIRMVDGSIKTADLVITIGGISAGERDYFPTAFDECGIERALQGASIQPGKPIVVGKAPNGSIVVGLPGNPVSALACSCLFAWPIVKVMLGLPPTLPWMSVTLGEAVKPNPRRRAYRPAIMKEEAFVPTWAGSGDLSHTAPTDGLLELPVQDDQVEAGTKLRFLPWP